MIKLYEALSDIKHFVFSTVSISAPETTALLLASELDKITHGINFSFWLESNGKVTQVTSNGNAVTPDENQRCIKVNSSDVLQQIIVEQNVIWSLDHVEKEAIFPEFISPTLFPIKWTPTARGFIIVDELAETERELFQFVSQFASVILNIAFLHKEVETQKAELSELTDILFFQNTQLSALNNVIMEIVSSADSSQIGKLLTDAAVTDLGAEGAAVFLADNRSGELLCVAASGGMEELGAISLGADPDVNVRRAMDTGRIVSFKMSEGACLLGNFRIEGWVIFPIKGSKGPIGLLIAEINDKDISDTMAILTNHGAIMLDNIALLDESRALSERMEKMAVTDHLTGLHNQRYFKDRIDNELSRARRYDLQLSMLVIDVDRFKSINDSFGHLAGDAVLKEISRRIVDTVRLSDVVARYGGDEFVVLLTETDKDSAKIVAEHVRESVSDLPVAIDGESIIVSLSIGVASFPSPNVENCEELFKEADNAMYRSKKAGRNRVETAE
jgi:diguanylate cyclase (GGDEF)-like protein